MRWRTSWGKDGASEKFKTPFFVVDSNLLYLQGGGLLTRTSTAARASAAPCVTRVVRAVANFPTPRPRRPRDRPLATTYVVVNRVVVP